jgi:hypothetical protein
MQGIEGEQVSRRWSITRRIIDVNDLDAGPAPEGTEHKAADAPKTVDAEFHG